MLMTNPETDKSVPAYLSDNALKRNNPTRDEERRLKYASIFFWSLMFGFAVLSVIID